MAYLFLSCRRCRHSLSHVNFAQRVKEKRKARGRKQNERQPKRTNSFCTCLTFHCSAAGAARCQIGKGQSARGWCRGGRGVRKVGMCAQGCHQWQQPSNVARKPTRCSIHFRFRLASISLSIYPPSDRSGVCSNCQSIWQLRGI